MYDSRAQAAFQKQMQEERQLWEGGSREKTFLKTHISERPTNITRSTFRKGKRRRIKSKGAGLAMSVRDASCEEA